MQADRPHDVARRVGYRTDELNIRNGSSYRAIGMPVAWVNMDARGAWRVELARELKSAGFTVDLNQAV
jgi:hypothetical protein